MATNFNPTTKISVSGPLSISDKRSADMPLDIRGRIETITDITTIPFAWEGMLVYVRDTKEYYKVTSLANRTVGGVAIPYYPATWVKFGSGGSTPSPTPSDIDAGDVSYSSGGTFSDGTVGKELQSLASDILGLAEDIHNLSSDIGTLSNLNTENKQDLVAAINEVLVSTGSTIAVVNNLISDSTTDALSAYQGKVLKGLVDGKVAGIKVQGESSVLPMDSNGIVTIPAGGGGTGTITGATVGGNDVQESNGILQFDAYPTADTMQYSNSTNYNSGTIGKEVKDLNTSVSDLSTKVAELDKPSPTPSPSTTTVNLANYATSSSSFTYDVDNKYIYNTKDTTFYQYSEEDNATTVYYGVFKVIGEDRYLMYSITNNTTFTYVNTYTELTLPENAKKEFALGSVAVVKRVNGEGESWKNGTVNLFCTKQNMPLRNRCRNINFNGSTAWRVLIKSEDGNTIFVYKAKSNGNYEWEINVPRSSTANFNLLDRYFDRPEASNVSFNDQNINIGADNVQDAIRIAFTNIQNTTCTLNLTVYKDSAVLANKSVHIDVTYQGVVSSILSGDYTTSSQGVISVSLPLGSVYTITFSDETNYRKPDTINGIADNNIKNITALYEPVAENEKVIVICTVKNTTNVYPNNKIAYIHYTNSDYTQNISVNPEWTLTFGTNGSVKTIVHNGNVETECLIPFGTYYTVELADWDSSEEQAYSKSAIVKTRALSETRVINVYYSYLLSGLFVVIKDDTDNVYGYTSYKVTNIDTTNDITTILLNNVEYDIRYTAGIGVQKSLKGQNDYSTWIAAADMDSTIIGVGVRDSTLINSTALDSDGTQQGYTNCCFMLCKVTYPTTTYAYINAGPDYKNDNCKDGRFITNLAASQEVDRPVITAVTAITKQTGNHTQHAFLASGSQWSALYLNYNNIKSIGNSLNINIVIASNTIYWLSTAYHTQNTQTGNDFGSLEGYNPGTYIGSFPDKSYRIVPLFSFN